MHGFDCCAPIQQGTQKIGSRPFGGDIEGGPCGEYPNRVNPLQRFTIYPELLLGWTYRAMNATGLGNH